MRLSRELATVVELGVARAPQGNFKAVQASANLVWIFDDAGNVFSPSRTTRSEFSAGIEHFDAARADGSTRELSAVVLKASRFLDRNLYVTGQAHSAFDGGAGGYAAGLFGVGWQTAVRRQRLAELVPRARGAARRRRRWWCRRARRRAGAAECLRRLRCRPVELAAHRRRPAARAARPASIRPWSTSPTSSASGWPGRASR